MPVDNISLVRCDEAAWRFLGLSLAGYDVLVSLGLAAVAAWARAPPSREQKRSRLELAQQSTGSDRMDVLIIGAGIGGLTLGLMLHRAGIACRVFEAAPELKAVGVGINILPHASRELCALGLEDALAKVAVTTREYCFYNRFGQYIYSEPAGRFAGYDVPQFSIHRGDLQMVLLEAFIARAGRDKVILGQRCTRVEYDGDGSGRAFRGCQRQAACRRSAAASWSAPKASIRPCASSFIRTKARRNIPASTCGAASRAGSRSCPAPA